MHSLCEFVPRGWVWTLPLVLLTLSGITPHTLSPPVSGAELQIPTGGKLVQDSDVCSFKVNSLHRKKLKKKSTPFPTKNNWGTLEKGLIPELGLNKHKDTPGHHCAQRTKTSLQSKRNIPKKHRSQPPEGAPASQTKTI